MGVLHRNLARNERRQRDRIEQEQLAHDVKQLQGPTLLEAALQWIAQKRLELDVQLNEAQESCRLLQQEIQWLDEQRDQLIAEAAAERQLPKTVQ